MLNHRTNSAGSAATVPAGGVQSLHDLFAYQPLDHLRAGEALIWEGDQATQVFEVASGVLRLVRMLSDGRRTITGFIYPGELVGLSFRDRYLYTVEAVTEVAVRRFARSRFEDELERARDLRPAVLALLCDEMAASQDQMVLLARRSAEERVAGFLVSLARRLGRDLDAQPLLDLPMTRLDMGDYLGLTIETVSRTMSRLTSEGIIAAAGRHGVAIRRMRKLEALAGVSED